MMLPPEQEETSAMLAQYRRQLRVSERLSIILRLYSYLGLLFAAGGIIYVVYSRLDISLSMNEQAALALSIMGLLMAFASSGYLTYRRNLFGRHLDRVAEFQAAGQFIEAWALFEELMKVKAFGSGEQAANQNLRKTLATLRAERKLDVADLLVAENLLQLRNSLVHGSRQYSQNELEQSTVELTKLISKLS